VCLIVEDDILIELSYKRGLSPEHKIGTITATDGIEGLKAAFKHTIPT